MPVGSGTTAGLHGVSMCRSQASHAGSTLPIPMPASSRRAWQGLGAHLVVARSEAAPDVLVVQDLHLEAEVLLQVLDEHDQEGQLDAKSLLGVSWASDEGRADVGAHDFQDARPDVIVCYPLYVPVPHCTQPLPVLRCLAPQRHRVHASWHCRRTLRSS